jgi:hypothetical protein
MSEFNGFICDSCGDVWIIDKRTRVTMKFEATEFCNLGSYWKDLCPRCIIDPIGWIPSKKRKTNEPSIPEGFATGFEN